MSGASVDVLLFGAHPDDVEWGLGGFCLLLRERGVSFAIVDLTRGEMGSRGAPATRDEEAMRAAAFLGAVARENLGMPDCGLADIPESRRQIAGAVRRHRPQIVIAPYWEDRHPDHAAAGLAIRNSSLYCTLAKLDDPNPPHKPDIFLYYLLHQVQQPSLVVDTSAVFERKLDLLRLHESQFSKTAEEFGVLPMGVGDYLFGLESRDRFFGSLIGAHFGEALVIDRPLRIESLAAILPFRGHK
jgi:bacillithiol biosynthesis deacetylase BshB1